MQQSQVFRSLLYGLVKQAKVDIERRFAKAGIKITPFQYGLLGLIKDRPATLAEMAKKLGIRPPSIVPYLDALEKEKIIHRDVDPEDRRKIQLKITAKGQNIVKNIIKDHPKDILNQGFHKLSKVKQLELTALLQELTKNLTQNNE
ncbi:MAG TPA: MarR family transcriptional regulator [Methylomirabilota bacterium]|jgi:DNA-binding MarR family transcriptional regulator|nr:MarR family transcriptional regulator [Methylomirabilota bacterium]